MRVLTQTQLNRFRDEGYLVVEDVFDPDVDFKVIKRDYSDILDGVAAEMLADGKIQSYDPTQPFGDRIIDVVKQAADLPLQAFDISLPQKGISKDTPMYLGRGGFKLLRHEPLVDLVEQLIGPEVYSNPVQHIRMKVPVGLVSAEGTTDVAGTPGIARSTMWHQDNGVVTEDADDTEMLTAWVPVNDATIENGCLGVLPGSHRRKLIGHCPTPMQMVIPDQLIASDQVIPVPMRAGSVLFLTRYTAHMSLPNLSNELRWSFDLRYQPTGQPTGRKAFPGFVVSSKARPESALTDHGEWVSLWERTRDELAENGMPTFNRWKSDAPWCA